MVVFTCNTCSAVLKRNKVESHCYQCRGCESLSCVDCGKDFWGDDYQNHTKCISEEEKYGRKDAVVKANKGEVKQELWIEQVQEAIEKASSKPKLKRLLERMKQYPNIPRKKVKFENFVKNSLKCYDTTVIAGSWEILMANKTQTQSQNNNQQEKQIESTSITNGHNKQEVNEDEEETSNSSAPKTKKERKEERRKKSQKKEKKDKEVVEPVAESMSTNDVTKKSKKRKRHEIEETEYQNGDTGKEVKSKKEKKKNKNKEEAASMKTEDDAADEELEGEVEEEDEISPPKKRKKTKFDWETVIKTVLEKKGELPLKKLKRKVLSEFAAQDAANYNEVNLSVKFDKKVTKIAGVKVFKERASLKT